MSDASFEDAGEGSLLLRACDEDDLKIISTLVQDAIFKRSDVAWNQKDRSLAILLNRFRWELSLANNDKSSDPERVKSVLLINDILEITATDITDSSAPEVFSCLELGFQPKDEIAGCMMLTLSGDRELIMEVDCIEVSLTDVTLPYPAASKNRPKHD